MSPPAAPASSLQGRRPCPLLTALPFLACNLFGPQFRQDMWLEQNPAHGELGEITSYTSCPGGPRRRVDLGGPVPPVWAGLTLSRCPGG